MLFAQAAEAVSWVNAAINLGALGILGYFFLKVQPSAAEKDRGARLEEIRLVVEDSKQERKSFAERVVLIAAELKDLGKKPGCKFDGQFGPGWYRTDIPKKPDDGPGATG